MKRRIFILLLLVIFLNSCSQESQVDTSKIAQKVVVSEGKSGAVGQVISKIDNKPVANEAVRLGQVFWDEKHETASFVLEGATSPGAITNEDGTFTITDIRPNEYVVIVGDVTEQFDIIKENADTAKVFLLEPGKVFDFGKIEVQLASQP